MCFVRRQLIQKNIYQIADFGICNTVAINAKNFHTLIVQINIGKIIVSKASVQLDPYFLHVLLRPIYEWVKPRVLNDPIEFKATITLKIEEEA